MWYIMAKTCMLTHTYRGRGGSQHFLERPLKFVWEVRKKRPKIKRDYGQRHILIAYISRTD